jgi:hypothetical protein
VTAAMGVSSAWLTLREDADGRARSRQLARAAAGLVEQRRVPGVPVTVHDLGSGTGSMMRWTAPFLPGPQHWVLHDRDASLTALARSLGVPGGFRGVDVAMTTATGELADLDVRDLDGADLVTASALLDVLTARDLRALVDTCVAVGAPVLLALSVVGDVRLEPQDPRDRVVQAAFDEHQRRDTPTGRLLGPDAGRLARDAFTAAGWQVREADSEWRLGPAEPALLDEWFRGWVDAAAEARPDAVDARYLERRRAELDAGTLRAAVRHIDLLAWRP